ncbi:MAG: hypothetical protein ACRD3J_15975, partial [Thermoanaerobaculia bacterium]
MSGAFERRAVREVECQRGVPCSEPQRLSKGRFALWSKVRELAELPTSGLGVRATGWPEQTHSVPKPWDCRNRISFRRKNESAEMRGPVA